MQLIASSPAPRVSGIKSPRSLGDLYSSELQLAELLDDFILRELRFAPTSVQTNFAELRLVLREAHRALRACLVTERRGLLNSHQALLATEHTLASALRSRALDLRLMLRRKRDAHDFASVIVLQELSDIHQQLGLALGALNDSPRRHAAQA